MNIIIKENQDTRNMSRKTQEDGRKKKKDNKKKTYQKYGKFTQKHIRQIERALNDKAKNIIEQKSKKNKEV